MKQDGHEHLSATRRYYNTFAGVYDRKRGGRVPGGYHDFLDDQEVAFVQRFAQNKDVLEVGCGTGLLLERVAAFSASAKGVDLSPGMLQHAIERGLDVTEASATALPFADNSFDVVFAFKVLAHIEDIRCAMSEMSRVTRPGGVVLAEFYNKSSLRTWVKQYGPAGSVGGNTTEAEVFTRFDSLTEAVSYLPAGMQLVASRGIRVVLPFASALRVPLLGALFRRAEEALCDGPLARFGGFWIGAFRKG